MQEYQNTSPGQNVRRKKERQATSPEATSQPHRHTQHVLHLQRTLGNRKVRQFLQAKRLTSQGLGLGLQRKLTVGAADDQYEQEADRVARQVMNTSEAAVAQSLQRAMTAGDDKEQTIQTKPVANSISQFVQRQEHGEEEDESIQTKSSGSLADSFEAGADVEGQLSQSKGQGSPLPDSVRTYMEPRFGTDFNHVRVHTGSAAVQMNRDVGAQAFTHGSDIYFGEGRNPTNLALTAHELTHVVQQTGNGNSGIKRLPMNPTPANQQIQTTPDEQVEVGLEYTQPDTTAPNLPSATFDPHQRVQTVIAAKDLQGLIAIQRDLRRQLLSDPLNPPSDVRAALATARHWTMEQIVAIRDRYTSQVTAASTGGSAGADGTSAVETIESSMDTECAPYLDVLMEGDPQYRYEHSDLTVSEKVFAAVRIHSVRRGVGRIGHRAEAEAEARSRGDLASGAWCGVFAYTQAEQGGGFDPHWRKYMHGEAGLRSVLNYKGAMENTWIWVFDHWEKLKDYHTKRGSVRWYEEIHHAPPKRGIQAGDLVLIDNAFGPDPDHITTAIAFDGRFLTTVGGNQGQGEVGVSRSHHPFDLQSNPKPNDVTNKDANGHPILDAEGNRTTIPGKTKNTRVHGIGRWSIVDYEQHIYSTSRTMPTMPPRTQDFAKFNTTAG